MRIILLSLLYILVSCKSIQNKKVSVDKLDIISISFLEKGMIKSKKEFDESIDKYSRDFIKSVKKTVAKSDDNINEENSKANVDILIKILILDLKSGYINTKQEKYNYHLNDSLVIFYKTLNKNIIGDYKVLNKNKETYRYLAKKDSITFYGEQNPYLFNMKVFDVKENKKDIKKIKGIDCYKVNLKVKIEENKSDEDFYEFTKDHYQNIEMYVTDKIKLKYHPFLKNKLILKNYYPLEMKIQESYVKGAYKEISVSEIKNED